MGHVLVDEDEPGGRAVERTERRRAQHAEVVAPAQEHRELERLRLALGVRQGVGDGAAQPEIVRVARAQVGEAGTESPPALDVQDGTRDLVHVLHHAVGREHEEAVLDAFDDRLDEVDAHARVTSCSTQPEAGCGVSRPIRPATGTAPPALRPRRAPRPP
jgi:hypothetical protein